VVACSSSADLATPSSPSAAGPDSSIRRIVVLGDSLAVSPSVGQSFPAVLQTLIENERLPWQVTNAGISGDTTAGGLRRIEALLTPDVGVLVLALGANDGLGGVPLDPLESNLSRTIEIAQARNTRVLLCGMETPPRHGWDYTIAFHGVFPRLAARHGVPLVPFLLQGVALVPEMNGSDGIHPNAAGARRIAQTIWPYLQPLLRAGVQATIPAR
jgi:acyl-CoA thioesterase-1